ncbi:hypothetical protein [uncultured Parasphingorhabdus sp.]|uniref:hypothetical protein n=1 Tax=uncultured Parasphingorhabdus sp. TaxID=2709694 RepID=UPI002AA6D3C9|nr:hypothetical protein [uncultured Parasphingorhabdus sp.]
MTFSREAIANGYAARFDDRTRAAHLATLIHARAIEQSGWPTVPMIRKFARLFEIPMAELGAFFGQICRMEQGRELWVDVLRNAPGTADAQRFMTRRQSEAFGFMLLAN